MGGWIAAWMDGWVCVCVCMSVCSYSMLNCSPYGDMTFFVRGLGPHVPDSSGAWGSGEVCFDSGVPDLHYKPYTRQ